MKCRSFLRWVSPCVLLCLAGPVGADDAQPAAEAPAAEAPAAEAGEADFDALIEQLDANRFSQRQEATEKLSQAGPAAFPALEKAAIAGTSREATTRAIEILSKHLKSGDEAGKTAAKETLERIAKCENPAASRRAQDALKPEEPAPQAVPGFGGIQIGGGQIQIQVQAFGGAGGRRVMHKNINGVKEIEAEEDGKKIKIVDDPNNGIKMEVTEKKDGKEATEKFEAKDADDLKKKHPEAHKIYEKYSQQQPQIQIQGIQIQPGQVPQLPIPIQPGNIRPLRVPGGIAPEQLEKLQKQIQEARERMRKIAEESGNDDLKKALEDLEAAQKELEGAGR